MAQANDPLLEWNRLNISNAERDLVKALFLGTLSGSEHIDRFSTWLLAGIAGTAALFITGIASVLPFLSEIGFKHCEGLLIVAGLLGLLAKQRALAVRIVLEQDRVLLHTLNPVLDRHEKDEDKIRNFANQRGMALETEIDIRRATRPFISAFPKVFHRNLQRRLEQGLSDPHRTMRGALHSFLYQVLFTALQTFFFFVFVAVAVLYASAI